MPCGCGGCSGRISPDGGSAEATVEVQATSVSTPTNGAELATCDGPVDRLEEAATALLDLRFADVGQAMTRGSFDRSISCWPLWIYVVALAWIGWLRS
jgi:hypothetical protein